MLELARLEPEDVETPTETAPAVTLGPFGDQQQAGLRTLVLAHPDQLAPYVEAWTALAAAAIEPNVFYEPWVLLPALRELVRPGQGELALVLVFGQPAGPPRKTPLSELWGLFPLERRQLGDHLPLRCLGLWQHDYSYVPIPLVHRDHGAAVMDAFFAWLREQRHASSALVLDTLPIGGRFHQLLVEAVDRRGTVSFVRDRFTRALLAPACGAVAYQERAIAGKHRKELRRQRKRLGELGRLAFTALEPADDAGAWLDEFLALEASGWKGRAGSALLSQPESERFFRAMALAAHQAGRLGATAIRLDGRALAMQILLRSGDGAYAFKLGYDEAFARYSPGVLLELDLVERVAEGGFLRWIDSAAVRHHPMINRIWTERRAIESWVIAGDDRMGLLLSLLPAARWIKRRLRGASHRGDQAMEQTEQTEQNPSRLIDFDERELRADFGRAPFLVRHRLAAHPLFELERLVALAQRLPGPSVEYNAGNLAPNQDPAATPRNGLDVAETVRRIRENDSWMVLKNVEQDPAYRALLDQCLDEIKASSELVEPGMCRREGFIFISSPNAVTPFHMDPEQNFLLQIAGRKSVHQWDRQDRVVIDEADVERFFAFAPHRNLPYQPHFEERARVFELEPGRGLHFPSMAPHWVKNGPEASISFSLTFRTAKTTGASAIYKLNQLMRSYGLRPRPPGTSAVVDRAKFNVARVLDRVRRARESRV
jgi:CelD/BcsL family acetyltransferase involved in cellulose biosynthesis